MRRFLSGVLGLILGSVLFAQTGPSLPQPRITSVFPMGAKFGSTVEVTIMGTDLDDPSTIRFSHPGITGELIVPPEPKVDPKAKTPPMPKNTKKGPPPTTAKFKVTVDAKVPPGRYEARVISKLGVSNSRLFTVDRYEEVSETDLNDDAVSEVPFAAISGVVGQITPKNTVRAQRLVLNSTLNGLINNQTDVDYCVVRGKAGERMLASCLASSIDSRARPFVEVFDTNGKRIGFNRNYLENDALADVTFPADGDYFLRISEFAYQSGGPEYFYRLTLTNGPWIDAVYPPVVMPGSTTPVTIFGRNLPGGKPVPNQTLDGQKLESLQTTITAPKESTIPRNRISPVQGLMDAFEFRLQNSNGVHVYLTPEKVVTEMPDNDKPGSAQKLTLPCEVSGVIEKRYDKDFYQFTAKRGEKIQIEVFADRLGSEADVSLKLRNEKGIDLVSELDDNPDSLHPTSFYSRNTDPASLRYTIPADGQYWLFVSSIDANVNFGLRNFYTLRVTTGTPDFRAVVMPRSREQASSVTLLANGDAAYDIFVHRRNAMTGNITITATGLPPGVVAKPLIMGPDTRWGTLVLSASADAKDYSGPISFQATVTIAGKPVTQSVRPAGLVWSVPNGQNNTPMIARMEQQTILAVRGEKAMYRLQADLPGLVVKTKAKDGKPEDVKPKGLVVVKPGDTITLPIKAQWHSADPRSNPLNIFAEATHPSQNTSPFTINNNQPLTNIPVGKADAPITITIRNTATPGTFNLVFRGDTQVSYLRDPAQKDKKTNLNIGSYTDPIPVLILPTVLAKATIAPNTPVKLGQKTEVTLRIERLHDHDGEFNVTLALPKEAKGITIPEKLTIPAGQDEVKIPITIASDAKPGQVPGIVATLTSQYAGEHPISLEAKFNVNMVK
ncbi:MAG: hypothetical protein ACRC8S_09130 [Fimbriiglobus sp.]